MTTAEIMKGLAQQPAGYMSNPMCQLLIHFERTIIVLKSLLERLETNTGAIDKDEELNAARDVLEDMGFRNKKGACPACAGKGRENYFDDEGSCPSCKGSGEEG